jgi:hypothetical protein
MKHSSNQVSPVLGFVRICNRAAQLSKSSYD